MPSNSKPKLIAVDIGNSRIKLGRFDSMVLADDSLPMPSEACDLTVTGRAGTFDLRQLEKWGSSINSIQADVPNAEATWLIASVHREAAVRLETELNRMSADANGTWQIRRLTFRDVPMPILVDAPERTGIDRLLAAFAANRLRRPDRAAVVVDLGTATTVDLVSVRGEFCGGAILPGLAMSTRALTEQTDALPWVAFGDHDQEPAPIGKSTVGAIESGLYWGTIGAIRELVRQYSVGEALPPDVFLTGGAAARFTKRLSTETPASSRDPMSTTSIRLVESLVLSGIALVHDAAAHT
jgi:type III pantothenate kinase